MERPVNVIDQSQQRIYQISSGHVWPSSTDTT